MEAFERGANGEAVGLALFPSATGEFCALLQGGVISWVGPASIMCFIAQAIEIINNE